MDHVAIMRKSWGLTEKILNGGKKIESRWYKSKRLPWDRIKEGESVYFKDSGEPVSIKTKVFKVLQFDNLTPKKVKKILSKYGLADGIEKREEVKFFRRFKNKQYCILVFLKNAKKIKPFEIKKKGFGSMAAWLTVPNISRIKK